MLTSFSDALYDRILYEFPGDEPVDRAAFTGRLPVEIAHFLGQTLDRRIEIEAAHLRDIAELWVDHGSEELALGREAYLRLLARHARFPKDEWPRAVKQAVQLVSDYLVRPVPTLIQFAFADEGELAAADVERRAGYFAAYSWLNATVAAYLEKQDRKPVRSRHLADVLTRVDRAMVEDWGADEWIDALGPLVRLSGFAGHEGVPVPMLEAFFDAKGAAPLAARARSLARRLSTRTLDEGALAEALAEPPELVIAPSATETVGPEAAGPAGRGSQAAGPATRIPEAAGPATRIPEAAGPAVRSPEATGPAGRAPQEGLPLWKQFANARPDAPVARSVPEGEPLWKKFRSTLAEGHEPTNLHLVEKELLGDAAERRAEFIRTLFGGSEEAYGRVLGALRSARNWPEASRLLADEVFRRYKVDIYGRTAVDFTNAVESRFR